LVSSCSVDKFYLLDVNRNVFIGEHIFVFCAAAAFSYTVNFSKRNHYFSCDPTKTGTYYRIFYLWSFTVSRFSKWLGQKTGMELCVLFLVGYCTYCCERRVSSNICFKQNTFIHRCWDRYIWRISCPVFQRFHVPTSPVTTVIRYTSLNKNILRS